KPDSVWAPSWVSWRYSDNYCGWAPLPPGAHFFAGTGFTYYGAHVGVGFGFGLGQDAWTFVAAGHFHDHEVWRHRLAGAEVGNVYRHTWILNNYSVDEHQTVVNRGIDRNRVPALAKAEEAKVAIRQTPERAGAAPRADRVHQEGSQLVLYRPKLGND